jgi:hypothetical protein
MYTTFTYVLAAVILALNGGDDRLRPVSDAHVLVAGHVVELQYGSELHAVAPDVLATVYRDGELFSAFRADRKGDFVFNLPIGCAYTISFGGKEFVNRQVVIDLREVKPGDCRNPVVMLDVTLFKPVSGMDYEPMNTQSEQWRFDAHRGALVQDLNALMELMRTESRLFKRSEKAALRME